MRPLQRNRKRDTALGFGGVRAPRPTHGFLSGVVGRPALWPPWSFAAEGKCPGGICRQEIRHPAARRMENGAKWRKMAQNKAVVLA